MAEVGAAEVEAAGVTRQGNDKTAMVPDYARTVVIQAIARRVRPTDPPRSGGDGFTPFTAR